MLSTDFRFMAYIEQYHKSEQEAFTGYWRLVFSGVIDNSRNSVEDSVVEEEGGFWSISASF